MTNRNASVDATLPLVSIIIPAYNAEGTIAESIQSATAQTWRRKEILVVDDGSTDRTGEIARRYASTCVRVISTENHGISPAINTGFKYCQGDYIQELDSDDLLAPDKIERQMSVLQECNSNRILLSCPWAYFYHRPERARFTPTSLWQDLSPLEWLIHKMGEGVHMQNATWLVSREMFEAAGPWNENLHYDQDGEFYLRVLMASEGTHFVPEGRIFYRASGSGRISFVGASNEKKDSLFLSMKSHIGCLRSLEESERTRKACLAYIQTWYHHFYSSREDIVAELQGLAAELHGRLEEPRLRWKFAWMAPVIGRKAALAAQGSLPELRNRLTASWDRVMYELEGGRAAARLSALADKPARKT